MKLEKDELIKFVAEYIGEDPDERGIELLENVTDSVEVQEGYTAEDLAAAREEVDAEWRKRYRDRFLTGADPEPEPDPEPEEIVEKTKFEELFEEEK